MKIATRGSVQRKQTDSAPSVRQAKFAFILLLIINILNYTDRSIFAAVQTTVQKEFGLTDIQLGLINSSFLLIYGILTLPLGVWADRGIRKNIIAASVTIWSVATALAGITHNFIHLLAVRSVLGVGEAGYAPASLSMIGDYFPSEVRGRRLSIWSTGNLIGTALGLIAGGALAQVLGWRWVFYIVGIPGLICAFLVWRIAEPKRGAFDHGKDNAQNETSTMHGSIAGPGFSRALRHLIKTPTYWILVAAFICSFFIIGAAMSWVPTLLQRQFHLSQAGAGLVSGGTLAGGSLIGTLIGGWLADHLQKRLPQGRMLITAIAFLVGAPLTWLALSMQNLTGFIVLFIPAIVALSFCLGPIQAILQDITTPDVRATAVGLALLLGHLLGDASSPTIVGAISDKTGSLVTALTLTGPTSLLLAGLICLIGLKTVGKDMQKMQDSLNGISSSSEVEK
ncbi:MFS transporter [Ktedonobacteria bacterium brp13]|nr:MFS transporter [Ktedonobacteria bacterium brp13]